jgi:putative cofactor-binding repeat protein
MAFSPHSYLNNWFMRIENLLISFNAILLSSRIFRSVFASVLILISLFASAQTQVTIGAPVSTTTTSGLSNTTSTGDRNERHMCIYSATELTAAGLAANTPLMSIAWEKTGVASYNEANLTIRIWLKHSASTTFAANPTFSTETSGATLVYQTTNGTIPAATGWLTFPFNMVPSFYWDGSQHLQVITELIRTIDWTATGFSWRTIATVTNAAANANGTIAAPPATLTRTGTRPQIRLGVPTTGLDAGLIAFTNPVSAPAGTQNIDVQLRNSGTVTLTSATITWTVDGGAPNVYAWSGSLVPGAMATVTVGSQSFAGGSHTVQATVSAPNGGADVDASNNSISKTFIACAPMSGSYTINKGSPTAGTNFNSFADFAFFLSNCGVGGNVVATVTAGSGPYQEQVEFQNIPGIGSGATVTIQGNGETITSPAVILSGGSNPDRHIVRLTNLSYFTINNLHVNMVAGSTAFIGIHMLFSGDHITISNCVVDMGTGTSTLLGAIAATGSRSSLLDVGNFSNITITGNSSTAGGYGAVIYGASNATTTGNLISNNTFTGTTSNGIYINNNGGTIIRNNNINFASSNGINLALSGNINTLVEGNFISCNSTSSVTIRGIHVNGSTIASPNKVVNNVIWNMNAPSAILIGMSNRTTGAEFHFNTVILEGASTGTRTYGFEEDLSNVQSMLRNNIFYITRNSSQYGAAIALASSSTVATTINSDYNVFYVANGANVAVRKGALSTDPPNNVYADLASWQAASGEDANSFQTDPQFQPGTAIPRSAVIDGQGITIAGITTDIVGTVRTSPPDPGAYEFAPPAGDAGITDFILPTIPHCDANLSVKFDLTNSGADPLNSVTINWTVNGVPQPVVNWTGPTLAPGASTIVTLGSVPIAAATIYNFSATASNPNGFPDVNPANDTYTYNGFRRGLEGVFTINSGAPASVTNYLSFQSMANALSLHGVCSAVTINVMNGPYTEQVVFNTIPGTSAVNTVTLNGNGRVLQFNPTNAGNDHILQLNGVTHMVVENLTVISQHATQGRGIHITNGASKLGIRNNTVNVSTTNSTSIAFGIIISGDNWLLDGSLTDSVDISGNTVTGGYSSIQLSGIHWNTPLTRIKVRDNTVLDWYGFGIYLSYTNGAVVSGNIIRRPTRTNSGSDAVTPAGITIPAGSLNFMLDKNRMYDFHLSMPGSPSISRGVYLSGTSIAPTSGTIQNNLIYGMTNDGAQYGIQDNAVNGPINIWHNTIVLNSPNGASTSNTDAINMSNFNQQGNTFIQNNVFVVTRGGTGVKRIIDVQEATSSFVSNYNVTWLNTTGGTQFYGTVGSTNYSTFANWQTTGKDLNSFFGDPAFVNPPAGNFTPSNYFADGAVMGTTSVGVLDDILNNVRSINPDPGAFEFAPPPCNGATGGTAVSTAGPFCTSGSGTITASGFSTGTGTSYQWQYSNDNFVSNINNLAGQTNPFSATTGTINTTTYYRLRVTCATGPATSYSNIVSIVVSQQVSITTQPQSQTVCTGNNVSFSVVATNAASYQWQKNGTNIPGATGSTYTINNVALSDAGNYTVIVNASSPCTGLTSATAVLTVNQSVVITNHPASIAVCAGSNASFTVTATGTGLTYQWRKASVNIPGATSATYTINSVVAGDAAIYDVVVTGSCGSVTSNAAALTVNATGSWIGVVSSNWNTAGNWCGGIPTPTTDVFIPSSAPNMPVLSAGNGNARNILIGSGGSLTVGTNGLLEIYGNLVVNGVFNASGGNLGFRGSGSQSIAPFTTINATMNGTGGIVLTGNSAVTGTLTLTNGNITLGFYNLSLSSGSSGSAASHIITNGPGSVVAINLAASDVRTIPVGYNGSTYNPVTLLANAGHLADNFIVNVKPGVFVNGVSGTLYTTHVVDRTWNINETSPGGSNVTLSFQWAGTEELAGFQRNRSFVMRHDGTNWQNSAPGAALGSDPFTRSLAGVTAFGPFAVRTEALPNPITGIYPNPATTFLNVILDMQEDTPVTFSVYNSGGQLVQKFQVTAIAGLSQTTLNLEKLSSGVYMLKLSALGKPEYLVQRFIKLL